MLILKLIVVPLALLLLGITERVHGPRAAGWLAGFPVIAAPLLLFITLDNGPAFGSAAALAALFGLVPWLSFGTVYAWCARYYDWPLCALLGFLAWGVVALLMVQIQNLSPLLEALPFAVALAAILFHSRVKLSDTPRAFKWWRLIARMIAGAVLTLIVAQLAGQLGSRWSGTLTTFPVVGSIIAISNHVEHGKRAVQEAVAGMVLGIVSVEIFCSAVYHLLGSTGIWQAFGLALAAAMAAQILTLMVLRKIR